MKLHISYLFLGTIILAGSILGILYYWWMVNFSGVWNQWREQVLILGDSSLTLGEEKKEPEIISVEDLKKWDRYNSLEETEKVLKEFTTLNDVKEFNEAFSYNSRNEKSIGLVNLSREEYGDTIHRDPAKKVIWLVQACENIEGDINVKNFIKEFYEFDNIEFADKSIKEAQWDNYCELEAFGKGTYKICYTDFDTKFLATILKYYSWKITKQEIISFLKGIDWESKIDHEAYKVFFQKLVNNEIKERSECKESI